MVVTAEKYLQLSNLAVAAAMDPLRWQDFLDALSVALGTHVCTQLIGFDQLTNAAPLAFAGGWDPAILDLYHEQYADKNPYAAKFAKCGVGQSISADELCDREALKKTQFYSDLLLPMEDINAGGGAMVAHDADRMFLIGGNLRARDREEFEHRWLELCVNLAPIIRQSLEINRMIMGLNFEKWAAERHLLGVGTTLFLVDADMKIHHTCAEADKLIGNGSLVGTSFDRRLRFLSEQVHGQLAGAVRSQANGNSTAFKNIRFSDKSGQDWICRTIGMRLSDLDRSPFGLLWDKSIAATLVAIKPVSDTRTLEKELRKSLGLSKAEARSVLLLAEGHKPAEIAEERQVSIHTVRNQIKSAMSKVGCHRQSELVQKAEQLRMTGGW
ncbi:helix-turn-helix transcriptional regulator [Roseibium sp. MMSF_3544]|uniref:helix-turn-helix transcriptional regulator n=1 Tax=unclassified Roseibium TaxID=2629323 RepID=UPI00273D4C14|nr:helix-turn-helix transcriptional regulator [Roseibium sp. MMSF_3544]